MTFACVRRPTCEARPAARKASPITYTPPWKYRTIWRGSIPSTVISAVGTPPSTAAVTVTSAGSGCADSNSRSCRRCSLTSLPAGKADCRRIASRFSRCSVLTEDLPSVGIGPAAPSARGRGRSDRRREVGPHAHLGEHGAGHGVAVEHLDLPVAEVPEVGARYVDLRSRRLDDAGRGLQRPEEGALNRQLDGDRVAKHGDAVQRPMDIGELLGHAEDKHAELLAPIALLAADVVDILYNLSSVAAALAMVASAGVPHVDHAVLSEAADKPGDVQDAALRRVV